MAAYASLASLMNNIEQILNNPHLYNSFDKKQIQSLLKNSEFLLDIIESSRYAADSKEAEDLERLITFAAHAAEDIIETHIVELIHESANDCDTSSSFLLEKSTSVKNKVQEWERRITCVDHATNNVIESSFAEQIHAGSIEESLGSMVDLQRIIEDMESLIGKANEVMKMEREEHDQPTHSTLPPLETGEHATAMVGLDEELTHLLNELTGNQSNRHTISIVGMGGMGKTTLARNLYANPLIIEHFDVRAWATVSQQYDAQEILKQLLSSLGKQSDGSVGELREQLYKSLISRRYLVILDDIWSVEAWDKVRHYFPEDGSSSRVVLTTRLSNVASACGSSCFAMKLLDEDKSWNLFCERALFPHKDDPLQLVDLGKEIVRLCKGLALSIVVIGGLLLKSPRSIGYWENVAKDLKSIPNSEEKQASLDVLSLSYSQLPPHLKPCFLYMGVFREDSEIRVSNIIRLWVAEGFIRPNGTRVVLEEIAEGCLKDLIDRNLVSISRRRANGDIGSCGIHDLLRDLCVKVAEQQEFFYVREFFKIGKTDRRVVCPHYENKFGSRFSRSIFTKRFHVEHIECQLLRVLGNAKTNVGYLQDVLYGYINMRYLAYNEPYGLGRKTTWNLPTSISLIWNLQTLMVSRQFEINKLVVASSQIWMMRQLRHIKFPKIYLPPPPSPSNKEDVLENFQTLTTAVNLRLSEEVCNIIPNVKKLSLHYDGDLLGYDDSLIECLCNLARLIKLESLKMEINLQAPDHELHKKLAFPDSLRKLSLSGCRLHWNDLRMIGSLPQLEVLNLEVLSVTEGEQWSPVDGQFCRLKVLKIETSRRLVKWDADSSHFPVLEKLVLIRLYKLEEIPLDIGDIPTLKLIRVDDCNMSTATSAMKIKEYQQDLDNDDLQIQIKIFDYEQKKKEFMQML